MKHSLFTDLLDLFYPNLCNACNKPLLSGENLICLSCKFELPETGYHLIPENPVERIFMGRTPIERATSIYHFVKNGRIQSLLHQLKYRNKPELGHLLGQTMANRLDGSSFILGLDYIVPIPLHPKKLKARGYNQSELIAQGMATILNISLNTDGLKRNIHTDSQTRKSRFNRWLNVEKVFTVKDSCFSPNSHILLVDDVITTGSTIEAAASELSKLGHKISFCTLAIA